MSDKTKSKAVGETDEIPVEVEVEGDSGSADAEEIPVELEGDPAPLAEGDRVKELEAEVKENYDRLVRTTADFENYRRRSRREIDDARTDAKTSVLKEMLPVVDNLERALLHAGADAESMVDGVKLVLRQFAQALERCGVAPIDAKGKAFDPNLHEAVSQIESADHEPGTVVEVLQSGYTIGERLLRPTLAVVSKRPAEEPSSGNGSTPPSGEA